MKAVLYFLSMLAWSILCAYMYVFQDCQLLIKGLREI